MPSKAPLSPFPASLSEKHLDINHGGLVNSNLQTWGYSTQPQSLAFPAPEIQLLATVISILMRWHVCSCLGPASDTSMSSLLPDLGLTYTSRIEPEDSSCPEVADL